LSEFGPRALKDYQENKRTLLQWLLTKGQDPFQEEGYAAETIRKTHYKIERTYRWVWKDRERYCWRFEPETANAFLDYLVKFDDIPDPQVVAYEKAIKLLFKFFTNTTDANIDWSYDRKLKSSYDSERDQFKANELRALFEASLSHNTINRDLSDKRREEVRDILARRFDMPKEDITAEDFDRANSWKIPSLIAVTNDLGLRPREIEVAKTTWMYPTEEVVRIPASEAIKSDSSWTCGLSNQTAKVLER